MSSSSSYSSSSSSSSSSCSDYSSSSSYYSSSYSSSSSVSNSITVEIEGTLIDRTFEPGSTNSCSHSSSESCQCHQYKVFEVETQVPVTVSCVGDCWNPTSTITLSASGAQLFWKDASGAYMDITEGNTFTLAELFGADLTETPDIYLIADEASNVLNDIEVQAIANPHPNGGGYPTCPICTKPYYHDSAYGTAYIIGIEVQEKPWGAPFDKEEESSCSSCSCSSSSSSSSTSNGSSSSCSDSNNGWEEPADTGERVVSGKTRPWYHLWDVNDNAIRAIVTPQSLGDWVTNTEFGGLSVTNFASGDAPDDTAQPKWKKINAALGLYESITATVFVLSGSDSMVAAVPLDNHKQLAEDVILNAIKSVEWEPVDGIDVNKINLGSNPGDDGGLRCFPEKSVPDGEINDLIYVRITLEKKIPEDMWGRVYVAWFDPKNPRGSLKTLSETNNRPNISRDNHGSMKILCGNFVIFDAGKSSKEKCLQIDPAHAGDNYIVAVHPNEQVLKGCRFKVGGKILTYKDSKDLETTLQTEDVLTVWRTLNVECDSMPYYNDPSNPCDITVPPSPADYLGLAVLELKRACVVIGNLTPDPNTPPPIGHNPMTENDIENLGQGRDLFGNCKEFWTVRIIMNSDEVGGGAGEWWTGYNTITISYAKIEKAVDKWNAKHPDEEVTTDAYVESTVLHEICHCLIDNPDYDVHFLDQNTLKNENDRAILGVRATIIRDTIINPQITLHEADLYNRLLYKFLTAVDIMSLQFFSRARD